MDNTVESATKKQKTEEQEPTTTTTQTTTENETINTNNNNNNNETKETTEPALSYEEIKQKKEKEALAGASSVLPQEHYAPAEEKVGIECFLGTHTGFSGILKQRYSDFLVNEIDTNGKVTQIDNFVAPVVEQPQSAEGTDEKVFIEMVGEEKTAEFLQYMKTRTSDKTSKFFFKSEEDKLKRTQLHRLIKERFKDVLTETQDNAVVVMPANQARTRRDDVSQWPADKPKYVEFLLFKENRETMNALLVLSQLLKTTTKTFSFAGTKDKRGVTVQRATAFRINPERLSAINPKLFGMKVGNFELGDLNGNKFQIAIRDINASDDEVKLASESLMKTGFINYYGLQRFGTGQVATNHVGLALLKKDWAGAAHLILDPRQGESVEATEARVFYQKTGDIKTTLDMLPNFLSVERMLLRGLKKSGPTSFLNAFSMIPRTMRMMYAHAYQSYIWNAMVSERIRLFGFQEPVVGDLVALDVEAPTANDVEEDVDLDEATESELEVQQNVDEKFKVAIVTEDDVKNKKYTIDQVVLPLPGYEIIYPQHIIAQKMKDMLVHDGLDPDNLKRAQKEYDLRGAYRKIIIKPAEFSWKIMHYDDVAIPLISTDIDKMNNAPEPADLPSSCYATMLFRELLKMPTSKLTQKTLSDEFAHRENRNKNNDNNNKKYKGKEVNFNRNRREKDQAKRKRD